MPVMSDVSDAQGISLVSDAAKYRANVRPFPDREPLLFLKKMVCLSTRSNGLQANTLRQSRTRARSKLKLIACVRDVLHWRNASNRHHQTAPQTCSISSNVATLRRYQLFQLFSLYQQGRMKRKRQMVACSPTLMG